MAKNKVNDIKKRLDELIEQRQQLEVTIIKVTGAIEILSSMVKKDEN